jgi:hypothetical protein
MSQLLRDTETIQITTETDSASLEFLRDNSRSVFRVYPFAHGLTKINDHVLYPFDKSRNLDLYWKVIVPIAHPSILHHRQITTRVHGYLVNGTSFRHKFRVGVRAECIYGEFLAAAAPFFKVGYKLWDNIADTIISNSPVDLSDLHIYLCPAKLNLQNLNVLSVS